MKEQTLLEMPERPEFISGKGVSMVTGSGVTGFDTQSAEYRIFGSEASLKLSTKISGKPS